MDDPIHLHSPFRNPTTVTRYGQAQYNPWFISVWWVSFLIDGYMSFSFNCELFYSPDHCCLLLVVYDGSELGLRLSCSYNYMIQLQWQVSFEGSICTRQDSLVLGLVPGLLYSYTVPGPGEKYNTADTLVPIRSYQRGSEIVSNRSRPNREAWGRIGVRWRYIRCHSERLDRITIEHDISCKIQHSCCNGT